jgi:hypothetical protein
VYNTQSVLHSTIFHESHQVDPSTLLAEDPLVNARRRLLESQLQSIDHITNLYHKIA